MSVDQPGVTATADRAGHLRLAGVRPPAAGDGQRLVYAAGGIVLWERLNYVPRIHWAGNAIVIPDAAARLKAAAQSPVVAGSVILSAPSGDTVPGGNATPASFDVVEDSGDNIKVKVNTRAPGYVVVTDNLTPNFDATVDGHSSTIMDADYAGGAVYVPAGQHEITIRYAPEGRRTGTYLSVASVLVLVLVASSPAWLRLRRRRFESGSEGGEPVS